MFVRRADGVVSRVERLELAAGLPRALEQLDVRLGAVAALRIRDPVELRLDLLEPPRLGLERGEEGGEVARRLAEAEGDVAELLGGALELRRERRGRSQRPLRVGGKRCRAVAVLRGKGVSGRRVRGGQLGHVPVPLTLGPQPVFGARLETVGRVDERAKLLEPGALGLRAGGELGVAAAGGEEVAPGGARFGAASKLLVADEGVEDVELVGRPREPALFELAGHGDQALAGRGQVLAGRGATPRIGAGAAVGEDAAGDDETLLVVRAQVGEALETVLVEQAVRQVELGLDVRVVRARPDEARVGAGAEQEPDRLREDRLAGAGLARDRVQAGRELELGLVDQDEVLDSQPAQHRRHATAGNPTGTIVAFGRQERAPRAGT